MHRFKNVLFSLFTIAAFFIDLKRMYSNFFSMINPFNSSIIIVSLSFVFFYVFYSKVKFVKSNKMLIFLSLLFTCFLIVGDSFAVSGSFGLIFGTFPLFCANVIKFIGLYIFISTCLKLLFSLLENNEVWNKCTQKKLPDFFNKILETDSMKPIFIFLIVAWLPYIISFFPIILSPDPSYQILQYYGVIAGHQTVPIDPSISAITNHHPVFHTMLLGVTTNIGKIIGNHNLGLFIYSIIQISIFAFAISMIIKYLKKIGIPSYLRLIVLLIYAFVPMFPLYALTGVKDTIFTAFIMLYIVMLFDLVQNKEKIKMSKMFYIIFILFMLSITRNNGFHVILLSFPFVIFVNKKNIIYLFMCFITFFGFYKSYNDILLPHFNITPGSVREMYSIPFQQTARYVKYYSEDITDYEKNIIDKVLKYDTLADRYKPWISDPVKDEFNELATKDDLNDYFKVWLQQFKKRPVVYLEATINNMYGYFTPNAINWYVYYSYEGMIKELGGINYHYNSLEIPRNILAGFACVFPYLPIGFISNIGMNTWLVIFMFLYLLIKKRYKYLIVLMPSVSCILICVASPVNTYFRYAMPHVFSNAILICLFLCVVKGTNEAIEKTGKLDKSKKMC